MSVCEGQVLGNFHKERFILFLEDVDKSIGGMFIKEVVTEI